MKILIQIIFLFTISSGYSQSLLTDSESGCKYLLPWTCDECTVKWTGSCLDSLLNGNGVLTVLYESEQVLKYDGQMKAGNFDGIGSYVDGRGKLEGFFKNGNILNIDSSLFNYLEINQISDIDITNINISFDGTDKLYYYAIKPKEKAKGTLVLFPSFYEQPEQVINNNTRLIKLAFDSNLLVVIPSINFNICLNEESVIFLNEVFSDAIKRYSSPAENFVIGGFSLGAMNSLRYSELAYQDSSKTIIQPKAVFAVDPPVNFITLYNTSIRNLVKDSTNSEAKTLIDRFEYHTQGTPTSKYNSYTYYSIYSNTERQGGNTKYLKDIPVRIYCDPDIDWWMGNRHNSYYDMNALDQTAMILQLNELGNVDAEFINALGKGYRLNGKRHPHSWSLIDPDECMKWILNNIK